MSNIIEITNEAGQLQTYDVEKNYFDPELWGRNAMVTEDEMKTLRRESRYVLQQYGYNTENIEAVLDKWAENKGWIINLFRQHPNYKEGKFYISFDTDVERRISKSGIRKFKNWLDEHVYESELMKSLEAPITRADFDKLNRDATKAGDLLDLVMNMTNRIRDSYQEFLPGMPAGEPSCIIHVNGEDVTWFDDNYKQFKKARDEYERMNDKVYMKGAYSVQNHLLDMFYLLTNVNDQFVDEALMTAFNSHAKDLELNTEAKVGQKVSKLYSKFLIEIGMSNIKDVRDISFVDQNGEEHTKQKDFGYNYQFYSVFADSINPVKFKRHTIISVNPIDYWTMSFGNSWSSCHTIDVDQLRKLQGGLNNNYGGAYSAGTESYLLDGSSIVFYYVDSKYDGEDLELQDKFKRCMFYLGENKLIQSRVYPDGRDRNHNDDSDDGLPEQIAKDIREVMEKVISECAGVPNSWVYKGGTSTASSMIESKGQHYHDYANYSDCGTAFLKIGDRLYKNVNRITVGHDTICPNCGGVHYRQRNIMCEDCETKDVKGHQITYKKAFKWNSLLFKTQELRDKYVRDDANGGDVTDVIGSLHEQDIEERSHINEDLIPRTPFLNRESETENETETATA